MNHEETNKCSECGKAFDPDLFPTLRACYDHTDDIEELREYAASLDQYIDGQRKVVAELVKDNAFLKNGWEIKDARIHEIESALTKSQEQFDRMNQLVQAYEKLLKG